jgi:hypothetical protein
MMKHGMKVAHIDRLPAGFADVEVFGFVCGLAANSLAAHALQFTAFRD